MAREAEIIVRAEVDHLAAGHADRRSLRALDHALAFVKAALLNVVELLVQDLPDLNVAHGCFSRCRPRSHGTSTTLPHWPLWMRSNPCSNCSRGMVWVTMGLMSRPALKSPARRYQVSKRRRPVTPCTRIPLKMISFARSSGTGSVGIPKSTTRPAFF